MPGQHLEALNRRLGTLFLEDGMALPILEIPATPGFGLEPRDRPVIRFLMRGVLSVHGSDYPSSDVGATSVTVLSVPGPAGDRLSLRRRNGGPDVLSSRGSFVPGAGRLRRR